MNKKDGSYLEEACKYYDKHFETIKILISALYEIDGCNCGGLAHVVVDDNNYDGDDLEWCIKYCGEEENRNSEEAGLVKLICEELLKLSMQQRACIFNSYDYLFCCGHCCKCAIEKGELQQD